MAQRRKRYDRQFKASAAKAVPSGERPIGGTRHKGFDAEKMGLRMRGDGRRRVPRKRLPEDQQGPRDREAREEGRGARARERDTKKFPGLLESRLCVRLELLEEHRGEIGPVKKACGPMEASRSGFYEHLGRKKPNAQIERGARAPHHAEALVCRKGRDPKTPHPEEGRAVRPSVEPGRTRFRRGRARRALGGRHHIHTHKGRVALSCGRDRRLLPQVRGLVDVRAHHREGRDRRDRAGGWQGGSAR